MKVVSRGPQRAFALVASLSLAALMLVAGGSASSSPEAADTEGLVQALWTPLGLRAGETTVVVQLAGDPVAVVQGDAGRKLSKAEKQAIKSQLKAKQDGLRGDIAKLGGTVLTDYQSAYNGLKVNIDRSKTDEIAKLAGVVAVRPLQLMEPDNTRGVALIGTPAVWDGLAGLHGENVKIAVLDTGIDFTHANFGGPGTTAAFVAADAADTLPANAALFGPAAPRIKGGIDLVGDAYNASAGAGSPALIPHPDPNPLDCNGHGSHVAGTAAGSGVLSSGATYTGAYNASTISGNSWTIGPGVAPKAEIYGVRVFGCAGSTNVVVDAIEWAVDNNMDVINMSLGSSFGSNDDPSAEASTNAAKAGVIVVASAGNSGPNQYITGSPASGEGAISVAANDPIQSSPGVRLSMTLGASESSVIAQNNNGATIADGMTAPIVVLRNANGSVSFGCAGNGLSGAPGPGSPTEYEDANVAGKFVVVVRGVCARVARAVYAQKAGAAGVILINDTSAYPPFEGPITSNPDTGEDYTVTIPFLGVRGVLGPAATQDGDAVVAKDGGNATLSNTTITNVNFTGFASFSSGGPRTGDGFLKPDITAPGVSITSTRVGSGNGPLTISGTSMAAPHVAGVAALTRQAHPDWKVADIKAAIVNTGNPGSVLVNRISRGGTGLVQPAGSTGTQVVALANGSKFDISVNFGVEELKNDFSKTRSIKLRNHGSSPATFNVAQANAAGSPHSVGLSSSSVTVPAGGDAEVHLTLSIPAATAGSATAAGLSFREVAGLVQFTPAGASDNSGITLRVPYYLVPRALSDIQTDLKLKQGQTSTTATITNKHGVIAGIADTYAWGLSDKKDKGKVSNDVRAIGVQSFQWDATRQFIGFAVNTYDPWSNASTNEFDIFVDVDNDGTDDYIVVGVDQGAVQTGSFNGRMLSWVFSTRSPGASAFFFAQAPTDSSTLGIFILSSQLCRPGEPCLNAANPRFTYTAVSFDLENGGVDEVDGSARFNAWNNAVSTAAFESVAPGGSVTVPVAINAAEWAQTPALGLMVMSIDNKSGADEAQLIELKVK